MTIDISSNPFPVKFSSLNPGDIFRQEGGDHCCLKIKNEMRLSSDNNTVDLDTNVLWHFDDGVMVYKAQSANLSVKF